MVSVNPFSLVARPTVRARFGLVGGVSTMYLRVSTMCTRIQRLYILIS